MFARIKDRNSQRLLTVPGWPRLLERQFKQTHNQVNKENRLLFAHLNAEGFIAHLHTYSFKSPTSSTRPWGLIALSAIALIRAKLRSHLCNQQPPVRSMQLQNSEGAL